MKPPQHTAGFTLIEVIIAMFVIALGVGALLSALTSSADSIGRLRDKSFAEWVALNRISEVRLATTPAKAGTTTGEVEFAGAKWRWRQLIADQGMAGMLRIDVAVARADAVTPETAATTTDATVAGDSTRDTFPAVATAYGFVGTAVALSNPLDPDWSLAAIAGGSGAPPPPPPPTS